MQDETRSLSAPIPNSFRWLRGALLIVAIALVTILAPIPISLSRSWFHHGSGGPLNEPFELFATLAAVAGIGGLALLWRRRNVVSREPALTLAFVVLFSFVALGYVSEFSSRSYDYLCYEDAARRILSDRDPYPNSCYYYPPLLGQSLAWLHQSLARTWPNASTDHWWLLFYLYQCSQFYLLLGCVALSVAWARRLGASLPYALTAVAVVYLVDIPLVRNFKFNQFNLILLSTTLVALLGLKRKPILIGLVMAVSLQFKPFLVFIPIAWLVDRRWKALAATVIAVALLFALTTSGGTNWTLWQQYIDSFKPIAAYNTYFRTQSVFSILRNTWMVLGRPVSAPVLMGALQAIYLAILGWFLWRGWRRVRSDAPTEASRTDAAIGNTLDAVFLAMLLSPQVWPHHFILLIPAILTLSLGKPGWRDPRVAWGAALVLALPVVELYPVSYLRWVGMMLLIWANGPTWPRGSEVTEGA